MKMGEDAERVFKTPLALATADEAAWLQVSRVGKATAAAIVKQIREGK